MPDAILRGTTQYVSGLEDSLNFLDAILKRADEAAKMSGDPDAPVKLYSSAVGQLQSIVLNLEDDSGFPRASAAHKLDALRGERYRRKVNGSGFIYKVGAEVQFSFHVRELVADLQVRGRQCTRPLKKLAKKLAGTLKPLADQKTYLTKAQRTAVETYLEAAHAVFAEFQEAEAAVDAVRATEVQAHMAEINARVPQQRT